MEGLLIGKFLFSFFFLFSSTAWSLTYVDNSLIQIAGDIGTISAGLEKKFSRYSIGGLYGIVPSDVSGGPVIETLTLRQTYLFDEWDRLGFYSGFNIFHVLGLGYQSEKFRDVPDRYYSIGGFRAVFNLGINVAIRSRELSAFYFEMGMNDIWILNSLVNNDQLNVPDHVTMGFGFKYDF